MAIDRMSANQEENPMPSSATARLEARISTALHSMLKRAAEIQRRAVTDFVVAVVQRLRNPKEPNHEGQYCHPRKKL
jgi:vacuolar-type H+-ATPase subunit E/Vma4